MLSITKQNLAHVVTLDERVDFSRKWMEMQTGRTPEKVKDGDSSFESDSNGKGYSYKWKLGGDSAATRFELWLTARGDVEFFDMFVGKDYIISDTITLDVVATAKGADVRLLDYRKSNDRGQGNAFRRVPMYLVAEFFKANDLVLSLTTRKAESVTA